MTCEGCVRAVTDAGFGFGGPAWYWYRRPLQSRAAKRTASWAARMSARALLQLS